MPRTSAGLLPYRSLDGSLEVFIAHMGGPLWARRDTGGWSLVKGEYAAGSEDPRLAAAREFAEEVGVPAPAGPWTDLGETRQKSGKVVRAFAVEVTGTLEFVASSTFEMEWPRGSGRTATFPEVDRAQWCAVETARTRLVSGQVVLLDRLMAVLGQTTSPST